MAKKHIQPPTPEEALAQFGVDVTGEKADAPQAPEQTHAADEPPAADENPPGESAQKPPADPPRVQVQYDEQTGRRVAPEYRQCPLCYHGELNGIGQSNGNYRKASTLMRRYYKCDRCGHTWVANVKPEEAERER